MKNLEIEVLNRSPIKISITDYGNHKRKLNINQDSIQIHNNINLKSIKYDFDKGIHKIEMFFSIIYLGSIDFSVVNDFANINSLEEYYLRLKEDIQDIIKETIKLFDEKKFQFHHEKTYRFQSNTLELI
jgi:hypothetical protein